jgi:hypothetical protein
VIIILAAMCRISYLYINMSCKGQVVFTKSVIEIKTNTSLVHTLMNMKRNETERNETKSNETKRNRSKRNEIKRNETKPIERKRNEIISVESLIHNNWISFAENIKRLKEI